ncbi:bacteriophage holin [Candidatus Cloacimonadota bacterium]
MKLNVKAFSLSCALIWGFAVLLYTWWIILLEGSTYDVTFLGRIYIGYNISITGSLIGFVWALVDGLILGVLFSLLYNFLSKKFKTRTT